MKNTVKVLAILVVVMAVSSAVFAAPSGRSNNCSAVASTDSATWGGGGNGPLRVSSSPNGTLNTFCPGTQVTLHSEQTRTEHGHGLANAFGKILSGLRSSLETATWGGGTGIPGR
jgi:hypothetical protein